MKKYLVLLLLWAGTLSAFGQSADEEAIKKVCETETRSWLAADAVTFNNCWLVRPYSRILVSLADGTSMSFSGEQMKAATKDVMGGGGTFTNSNYLIHVSGNTAWVTYDEVKTGTDGKQSASYETRLLEKVDGQWKITAMTAQHLAGK